MSRLKKGEREGEREKEKEREQERAREGARENYPIARRSKEIMYGCVQWDFRGMN